MNRLLIIANSTDATRSFRRGLWRYRARFAVDAAEGEEAGLMRLSTRAFDAVVVDLPSLERAIGLLRRVRDVRPGCLRLAFGPRAAASRILLDHDLVHRYLLKPSLPNEIVAALERCLVLQEPHSARAVASLRALGSLPSQPSICLELERELGTGRASVTSVARIAERDPTLCARVLRVVNSAWFGLGREVTSMTRAISHLGLDGVRGIAVIAGAEGMGDPRAVGLDVDHLLQHSLKVAVAARSLAAGGLKDMAFCAGLMHDVGKIGLAAALGPEYGEVLLRSRDGEALSDAEVATLGIDHAAAGAHLLGLWNVPKALTDAVAAHTTPVADGNDPRDLASVLRTADRSAHATPA